jgi:hypothetical protein
MVNSAQIEGKTKEKARTAHFRDDVVDENKTAYARITSPTNHTNTNTTTNKDNNKTKNKKQKTNNTKKTTYKTAAMANMNTDVTTFSPEPARNKSRIKNSRKASIARHKGKGSRHGSAKNIVFTHKTRFDVSFTLTTPTLEGRVEEVQKGVDEIIRTIQKCDDKAKLLPWKTSNQAFHPAIAASNETTASFIDIYLSRTWLGNLDKKHRAYFQIHIGHNEEYGDTILPEFEDFNSHMDRKFQHSMIQAEDTVFIGWFLYSTINIDIGGLSDAIFDTLGIEVGLRWMDIRMSNKGGKTKAKPVKAIHVEVEKNSNRRHTETLMKHYGRTFENSDDFPLGIRLRFCKNIDSAAYPKERTKLIRLRSRQAQLLDETRKTTSAGILDLDAILTPNDSTTSTNTRTTGNTTLRTAIMDIHSRTVKKTPLFRSVDISYNSEDFVFAYHQSMASEAKAMVDYLYPYLVHFYTAISLKRAFDATHIKEMTAFKYNISSDRVEDTIAEEAYAIMEKDNITGAIEFADFDLSAMSLEEDETSARPAASILGKIYGDSDSISTQQHGRHNTTEVNTSDVLEVTEDELMELQRRTLLHTQSKHKTSARKSVLHIHNVDTKTMLSQIRKDKDAKDTHNNIDLTNDSEASNGNDSYDSDDNEKESMVDNSSNGSSEAGNSTDDTHNEDGVESTSEEEEEFRDADQMEEVQLTEDSNNLHNSSRLNMPATNHTRISQSLRDGNFNPPPKGERGEGY